MTWTAGGVPPPPPVAPRAPAPSPVSWLGARLVVFAARCELTDQLIRLLSRATALTFSRSEKADRRPRAPLKNA